MVHKYGWKSLIIHKQIIQWRDQNNYVHGVIDLVHTETFSCVFVLFTVLKGIENNQLITWNNTKTQENVSV